MSAYFISFIGILLLPLTCLAQFEWINEYGGSKNVEIYDLHLDDFENIYSIGYSQDDVTFGENHHLTKGGFLLKHDIKGNLLWDKFIRSDSSLATYISKVKVDGSGNVYIIGSTQQQPRMNSFIAKYDSDENLQWIKVFINLQYIKDIAVNSSGEVAFTSWHHDTVSVNGKTLTVKSNSIGALLSASGQLQWIKTLGSDFTYTNTYHTYPHAVAIDNEGNTYFSGKYAENLQIDDYQVKGSGMHNLYFAKFKRNGSCEWLKSAESTIGSHSGGSVGHNAIKVDENGNVYVTGFFYSEFKIETSKLVVYNTAENNRFTFLLKLNSDGKLQWLREVEKNTNNSTPQSMIIKNKKIYVTGSGGYYSLFVNIFNLDGALLGKMADVPIMADWQSGLGIDKNDAIYLGGYRHYNQYDTPRTAYLFKYGGEIINEFDEGPIVPENPEEPQEPELPQEPEPQEPVNPDKPISQKTEISGFHSVCITDPETTFSAFLIDNADHYEWEITHNHTTQTIQTDEPKLTVSLRNLSISGIFQVRVRGINSSYMGSFSEFFQIETVNPLDKIDLFADCEKLQVVGGEKFTWYRNGKQDPDFSEGQVQIHPAMSGTYYVEVSNACGKVKSNEVFFEPANLQSITIPNVFTPDNEDNINQFFIIPDLLLHSEIKVYNRWGKLVYFSKDYNNDWDGSDLPTGPYYYALKNSCFSKSITGYVSILR